jgi:hypothetical protein
LKKIRALSFRNRIANGKLWISKLQYLFKGT